MAVFLDKKEQVIDFKLTSYGRYLLSIGSLKPTYYAFFDDNIWYSAAYQAGAPATRPIDQNKQIPRIKEKVAYLESVVVFRDPEKTIRSAQAETINFLDTFATSIKVKPSPDVFKFTSVIGDAFLNGKADAAPAWQVLALQSRFSSSFYHTDDKFDPGVYNAPGSLVNSKVPQLNIQALYTLKVRNREFDYDPTDARELFDQSTTFADDRVIQLEANDPLLYFDEINTQLLTENFDIEVFEVISGSDWGDGEGRYSPTLQRKYFEKKIPQIENGFMMMETPVENQMQSLTTASVEYYFDVLTDASVNQTTACEAAGMSNKQGYYINFDFDCETSSGEAVFYDIYGNVTEPEICQT